MDRKRILIAIIGAAVLAFLCLALPGTAAGYYSSIMLPLTLLAGFILALMVASNYSKDLKNSFIFLALFLVIYMLVNIEPVWNFIVSYGESHVLLVPALQFVNWAMLVISCVFTVRVIEAKKMNGYGWLVFGLVGILCVYILVWSLFIHKIDNSDLTVVEAITSSPVFAISLIMIRIFDMAIVLMLVPVLLLYIQYTRSRAQESLTFALTMCGIIISLSSLYFLQIFSLDTPQMESTLWLFGYLVIVIGLYAHRRYDDYGFKMIEKALG